MPPRVRQGAYGICGLLAAGILTQTFAGRWSGLEVYAVSLTLLLVAVFGIGVEVAEKRYFRRSIMTDLQLTRRYIAGILLLGAPLLVLQVRLVHPERLLIGPLPTGGDGALFLLLAMSGILAGIMGLGLTLWLILSFRSPRSG